MNCEAIKREFPIGSAICIASKHSVLRGLFGTVEEIYCDHSPKVVCSLYQPIYASETASYEKSGIDFSDGSLSGVPIMSRSLRRVSKCRIYQIKAEDSEFAFMPYDTLCKRGYAAPPADIYSVVFDGQFQSDDPWDIYKLCSDNTSDGCEPLTTSDIIEIYDDEGSRFYYHNLGDFVEINFGTVTAGSAA